MVMVFDERGEQVPEYQDRYDKVRENILKNAPPDTVFWHLFYAEPIVRKVAREEW